METNGNEEVVCSHGEEEGGDGNYSLPSLPCLGREREMKEQKQSIYINRSSTAFQRGGQWKRVQHVGCQREQEEEETPFL